LIILFDVFFLARNAGGEGLQTRPLREPSAAERTPSPAGCSAAEAIVGRQWLSEQCCLTGHYKGLSSAAGEGGGGGAQPPPAKKATG